ncbi:putative DnaJ domain, tetratricopeptide-like helical domain superfamily [Plasmopara halstedii]
MVRLVEYSASSDEDRDVRSDDGSQWSSFGEIPSSPSDSLSYPMPSPESDEDDEDYAPSESSLADASSVTSSVDTDDLDPDRQIDDQQLEMMEDDGKQDTFDRSVQDNVIDVTQQDQSRVFYAWKDLNAAFDNDMFKRRSIQIEMNAKNLKEEKQTEKSKANFWNMETNTWSSQTTFVPGIVDKKPRVRRRASKMHPHFTGVSPRFSTLNTEDHHTTLQSDKSTNFVVENSSKMSFGGKVSVKMNTMDENVSETTCTEQKPAFKSPFGSFDNENFVKSMRFQSSCVPSASCASDIPISDGPGFAEVEMPYKFAEHGNTNVFSTKVRSAQEQNDTDMNSPRAHSATRLSSGGEFLFGQAYKNRLSFASFTQKQNETTSSIGIATNFAMAASEFLDKSKSFMHETLRETVDADNKAANPSVLFTTGVAGPTTHRRRKISSTSSGSCANVLPTHNLSTASTFGKSVLPTATAFRERPAVPSGAVFDFSKAEAPAHAKEVTSAIPTTQPFTSSFLFGDLKAVTSQALDPLSYQTCKDTFVSTSLGQTTSNIVSSGQYMFQSDPIQTPFQFGETKVQAETATFPLTDLQRASMSTLNSNNFQIGCSDTKQTARIRSRKAGMFSNKINLKKDAKVGLNEPEPSPGFSFSSPAEPFPFSTHERRSRKNARLRQSGRNIPADPFVTTTCQPFTLTKEDQPQSNAAEPISWKKFSSVADSSSVSADSVGSRGVFRTQERAIDQDFNALSNEALNVSSQSSKRNQDTTRPAFAGPRRILRAALRNVGTRTERTQSASPSMTKCAGGDANMDSEDERDWEELKRLGNVAHCAREFQDAAEFYRQSIEVLDSLLYHEEVEDSPEIRTDKAKLHANRAASLLMLMQITEAQHECRRSIEVDKSYASAYLRLGRIQVLLGDTANAQANLSTAKQLMEGHNSEVKPGDKADRASLIKMEAKIKKLVLLQSEIKWYVDNGDHNQALIHTDNALALAPRSRKLQVQKAQILLRQRKLDSLIQFCYFIIEKHQETQRKMTRDVHSGDKISNDETIEKITILGIDLGLLWATTLHYQDKVDEAVQVLQALEAVAPCSSHVIQLKRQWQDMKQLKSNGNEHFNRGEYQEAVRYYSEAVLIDPQHQEFCAIIYCNRAAAQMGLKRHHTAILDCNEALQRKPEYPRALLRRARCHAVLEMYHEAVKDFDRYLQEQSSERRVDTTDDVRSERNEAKAAIARACEEAKRREAAKKRAEREQREEHQRRSNRWENSSWGFQDNFRNGSSTNDNGRNQSSHNSGRSSFMARKSQRRTHYDVLGIEKKASDDEIRKAYRKLALVYHPDKAKTSTHAELFKEMTAAYNVLSDGCARSKYDRELMYNRFGTFYED